MRFKEFLNEKKQMTRAEKDAKKNAGREALAALDAENKAAAKAKFDAKYNTGEPKKIKLDVMVGNKMEKREFTVDNMIDIVHKLEGITLIDMSAMAGHVGTKVSYAIKKDGIRFFSGSLPEFLFDLPSGTRQKKEFVGTNDLRRETFVK